MLCVGCCSQTDCRGSDSSPEFLFTVYLPTLGQVPLPPHLQPALCGNHQGQHWLLHGSESKTYAVRVPLKFNQYWFNHYWCMSQLLWQDLAALWSTHSCMHHILSAIVSIMYTCTVSIQVQDGHAGLLWLFLLFSVPALHPELQAAPKLLLMSCCWHCFLMILLTMFPHDLADSVSSWSCCPVAQTAAGILSPTVFSNITFLIF